MPMTTAGIHHVTAIAGDPQRNLDFYTGVLGLRLVKVSVNQDDTGTYHFFYGDAQGSPGTELTFFPWQELGPGLRGACQATATAFAAPPGALDYWRDRLERHGVRCDPVETRFGEAVLPFYDPDGLRLELVFTEESDPARTWAQGGIPEEYALRGFDAVTLEVPRLEPTAAVLTALLGFERIGTEGRRVRFRSPHRGPASRVDVIVPENPWPGRVAVGTVHHVAWRVDDPAVQEAVHREIREIGLPVSPIVDRFYFRSIYFREPGGVLFEIATDGPGFAVDEPPDQLGSRLSLPPFLEPQRREIEASLPRLRLPGGGEVP